MNSVLWAIRSRARQAETRSSPTETRRNLPDRRRTWTRDCALRHWRRYLIRFRDHAKRKRVINKRTSRHGLSAGFFPEPRRLQHSVSLQSRAVPDTHRRRSHDKLHVLEHRFGGIRNGWGPVPEGALHTTWRRLAAADIRDGSDVELSAGED